MNVVGEVAPVDVLWIHGAIALVFGVLSFFFVMREISFLGVGISHIAFGGLAIGSYLGVYPFWFAMLFCVLAAPAMLYIARISALAGETVIGMFFGLAMALGGIFSALSGDPQLHIESLLVGNETALYREDAWFTGGALFLTALLTIVYFRRLLRISLDEEYAKVSGLPVLYLDSLLMLLLSVAVVAAIRFAGMILISSMVVLPASFGLLGARSYRGVLIRGVIFALYMAQTGWLISRFTDIPPALASVVVGTVSYLGALSLARVLAR